MASGYEQYGKAQRKLIKRNKKTRSIAGGLDVLAEALDTTAGVLTFAGGQMKKQDTAWKEYEAGYEALGGDVADIPKRGSFWKQTGQTLMPGGDKGFYEMPEGEVRIGNIMYDREKIQDAGSFLSTDAAAALFSGEGGDAAQKKYLERVAPGKALPTFTSGVKYGQTGGIGSGTEFGQGTGGRFSPVVPKTVSTSEGIGTGTEFGQRTFTGDVQHELTGGDFQPSKNIGFQSTRGREGIDFDQYTPTKVDSPAYQIPDQNLPIPSMNFYERKKYNIQNQLSEKYGPQRGEYDPQTGIKRYNLMESLYENNERRKVY